MIKDQRAIEQFEIELVRLSKNNLARNLKIVEELHKEALALNVFKKNSYNNFETIIRISRIINGLK